MTASCSSSRGERRYALPLLAYPLLAIAGVIRYRQIFPLLALTLLLATQAIVMCVLPLFADHIGPLARLGIASPLSMLQRLAALWLQVGSYLLLGRRSRWNMAIAAGGCGT
jgi:hypothetical protein